MPKSVKTCSGQIVAESRISRKLRFKNRATGNFRVVDKYGEIRPEPSGGQPWNQAAI
jgi:hypothetical protein